MHIAGYIARTRLRAANTSKDARVFMLNVSGPNTLGASGSPTNAPWSNAIAGRHATWMAALLLAMAPCLPGQAAPADGLKSGSYYEIQNKELSKRHDCFLIQGDYGRNDGAHSWNDRPHEPGYNRESYQWKLVAVPATEGGADEGDYWIQNRATLKFLTQIDTNEWSVDVAAQAVPQSIWKLGLAEDGIHHRIRNKASGFLLLQASYGDDWDVHTYTEDKAHGDAYEWYMQEVVDDPAAEPIKDGVPYRISNKELGKRHDCFLIQGNYGNGSDAAHSWCDLPGDAGYSLAAYEWVLTRVPAPRGGENDYWIQNNATKKFLAQADPDEWDVDVVDMESAGAIWTLSLDTRGTHYRISNKQSGFGLIQADYGWEWDVHTWDRNTGSDAYLWDIRDPAAIHTVTILSIRCINPSTGKDYATKKLFQAVDMAVELGAGAMTGGGSIAASGSVREILKTGFKAAASAARNMAAEAMTKQGMKKIAISQAQRKAVLLAGNTIAGDDADSFSELLFDQVYGTSPDDLYVRVNHIKRWPSGDGFSIKSPDEPVLDIAIPYDPRIGFVIELMEYDSGSDDDGLGWAYWSPGVIERVMQVEDHEDLVVIRSDSEGSAYAITIRIGMGFETPLK
jgi:hypothetical protein